MCICLPLSFPLHTKFQVGQISHNCSFSHFLVAGMQYPTATNHRRKGLFWLTAYRDFSSQLPSYQAEQHGARAWVEKQLLSIWASRKQRVKGGAREGEEPQQATTLETHVVIHQTQAPPPNSKSAIGPHTSSPSESPPMSMQDSSYNHNILCLVGVSHQQSARSHCECTYIVERKGDRGEKNASQNFSIYF